MACTSVVLPLVPALLPDNANPDAHSHGNTKRKSHIYAAAYDLAYAHEY
jgi:hypothetical protein